MFKQFHPPHIYQDNSTYFITGRTYNHAQILVTNDHKQIFWNTLNILIKEFNTLLHCWTINTDHYHLLIQFQESATFPSFMKELHGKTSYLLNKFDLTPGRKIWVNYWDRIIRSETDFYIRMNYMHHNCIKHGYTKHMKEYKWSSYMCYLDKYGREWLNDSFQRYPIIDFSLECPD